MGSGQYGFNKRIQGDVDIAIRKLTRKANILATRLEHKFPEAGSFFKDRFTRTNDPAYEAMSNACKIFRDRSRILPGVAGFSTSCTKSCLGSMNILYMLAGEIGNALYKKEGNHLEYMQEHYKESKCPFTKLLIDAFPIYIMTKTGSLNRSDEMKNNYRFTRFNQRQASEWTADEQFGCGDKYACGGNMYADEQFEEEPEVVDSEYVEAEDYYDDEEIQVYYDGIEEGYDMGYNDALKGMPYENNLDEDVESDDEDQVIYDDGFEDGYEQGYNDAVQGLEYDNGLVYEDDEEEEDDITMGGNMFASEEMAHSLTDEFDMDGDDLISMDEWQGSMAVFLALDTDQDGFISRQEIEEGIGMGFGFGFNKTAAGVKGRSGGPRENAGRPKKPKRGRYQRPAMNSCSRQGKGKGNKKCYTREPAKGGINEPGLGEHMYGLHNDYGKAKAGKNNSAARKKYNKRYYAGMKDQIIERKICPNKQGGSFNCAEAGKTRGKGKSQSKKPSGGAKKPSTSRVIEEDLD